MVDPGNPVVAITLVVVLGLIVGSFLNVVIARLPVILEREWRSECRELLADQSDTQSGPSSFEHVSLMSPRSRCPKCGSMIRAFDNVPVLSWLLLRGRCRRCGEPISAQYPLIELLTALMAVGVLLRFGATEFGVLAIAFSWFLIPAAMIDLRTTLLPDNLTLPLLWLGLVAAAFGFSTISPTDAIVGAAAGYLVLWGLYHIFRLLTGKEGMGYGDFKLLAALGAWVGWQGLPVVILLSSGVGAVVGLAMIALQGRDRAAPIPFGPFLAAGGWIALMWGEWITSAYLAWSFG